MKRPIWNSLLTLGRVSNLPTIVSNVTVGYTLAGGVYYKTPLDWIICIVAILCFYEGGMFLNDICDYTLDLKERPGRPLPSGLISRVMASVVTFSFFLIGIGLIVFCLPEVLPLSLGLVGLIVTYNLVHVRFILSPLLMGACRGSVYLIAAKAANSQVFQTAPSVLIMALGLMLYISAVSFIARDELQASLGRIQKVSGLVLLGVLFWPIVFTQPWDSFLFLGFLPICFWFAVTELQFFRGEINPPKAVGRMLSGISLWDAFVLATLHSMSGMCLAWVCFGGARLWQRRIQAT